jgi:hypothetical protein
MEFAARRIWSIVAFAAVAASSAGCPVDPATVSPDSPVVDVGGACRNVNNVRVTGTKPAGTKVLAAVTAPTGATTEVEVVPLDDLTDFAGAVFVDVDGSYTLAFAAENAGGARSDVVGPFVVQIDREAPPAPECVAPPPVEAPPGSAGSVETECTVAASDIASIEVDGVAAAFGGEGPVTLPVPSGTSDRAVVAVDACGNRSPPATVATLGLDDLTPPVGLTVQGPATAAIADGAATVDVAFSGAKEAGADVAVRLCRGACVDETAAVVAAADDAATWTGTIALPAGTWTLAFSSRDAASNESAPVLHPIVAQGAVVVPTVAPPPPAITNALTLALAGGRGAGTRVLARLPGVAEPLLLDDGTEGGPAWTGELDLSGVVDAPPLPGTVTFTLFSDDGGAVVSADTAPFTVLVDRTPPAAPAFDAVDGVLLLEPGATSGTFPFTGTGEPGATVVVGGVDVGVVDDEGAWSFGATLTAADTGVRAALRDPAGNLSSLSSVSFVVQQGLLRPTLTTPAGSEFPVFTRNATVLLVGTRRPECGPCGVEAVDARTGATTELAPIAAGAGWTGTMPLVEGSNRFFVRTFIDGTPRRISGRVGLADGTALVVVKDTTPPAPPVVRQPIGEQGATSAIVVEKGRQDGLLVRVNGETEERSVAAVLDNQDTAVVREPLAPGNNLICLVTIDRVGNRSDDGAADPVCVTVNSAGAPRVVVTTPQPGDVVTGTTMRVEAIVDGGADVLEVCVGTTCTPFVPDGQTGDLQANVTLPTVPAGGSLLDVDVCAVRGVQRGCVTTRVLRWADPFRLSLAESVEDALVPAMAVDSRGAVHVVWEDDNKSQTNGCVAPHFDVIVSAARSLAGKLVLTTSTGGGFAAGQSIRVVGAGGFDGTYTVASVSVPDRTVTTTQSVAVGLQPEAAGNVFGAAPATTCTGPDIFYRRLDTAGWSALVNVSDVGVKSTGVPRDSVSRAPVIAVDTADNVHIVWEELGDLDGPARETGSGSAQREDLVHRVIDGARNTFGTAAPITTDTGATRHLLRDGSGQLVADGDGVALVWREQTSTVVGSGGNLRLARFVDGAWGPPVFVATGSAFEASLAVDADRTAWVVWSDDADGNGTVSDRDIFLCPVGVDDITCEGVRKTLVTGGVDAGASTAPDVVLVDGALHVVWLDDSELGAPLADPAVFHRRYLVSGNAVTASTVTRLSADGDFVITGPSVAVGDEGNVVVAYPSLNLAGATFNVARVVGRDGLLDTAFDPPTLLTGASSGSPQADALDVAVLRVAGRSLMYAFASDADLSAAPGYRLFVHAQPVP